MAAMILGPAGAARHFVDYMRENPVNPVSVVFAVFTLFTRNHFLRLLLLMLAHYLACPRSFGTTFTWVGFLLDEPIYSTYQNALPKLQAALTSSLYIFSVDVVAFLLVMPWELLLSRPRQVRLSAEGRGWMYDIAGLIHLPMRRYYSGWRSDAGARAAGLCQAELSTYSSRTVCTHFAALLVAVSATHHWLRFVRRRIAQARPARTTQRGVRWHKLAYACVDMLVKLTRILHWTLLADSITHLKCGGRRAEWIWPFFPWFVQSTALAMSFYNGRRP